jgi:co-chaperonin GroES (HSP10)
MSNKKQVQRIYIEGWQLSDFVGVKEDMLIIEPLKPDAETATKGGIILPGQEVGKIPGVAAFLYRVAAKGPDIEHWPLAPQVGDIVIVRNAMVDPLHVNQALLTVHRKHVLAIVRETVDVEEPVVEDPATTPRGVHLVQA